MRRFLLGVLCMTVGCATPSSSSSSRGATEASVEAEVLARASREELKAEVEKARESKDWARLQSLFRELARREPDSAEALASGGLASILEGQKEKGIAQLEQSVTVKDSATVRYVLASVLQGEARSRRALEHLERAVELDGDSVQFWFDLALLRIQEGQLDEAFAAMERARALAPQAPRTEALEVYLAQWHAAMRMPEKAAAYNAHGVKMLSEGRRDEALADFQSAVSLAPEYGHARLNLATQLARKGFTSRAEQEFREAIPGFHEREKVLRAIAQNNLADLLVQRGVRSEEPVALVRAAISARGERPAFLDTLARACDASGDTACAVDAYRKLLVSGQTLPAEVLTHARRRLETLAP